MWEGLVEVMAFSSGKDDDRGKIFWSLHSRGTNQ